MKIKTLKLENFRSYQDKISIDLDDLNVFVGKNVSDPHHKNCTLS